MDTSTLIQVVLMGVLVVITGIYAWRTHVISKATEKQAEATKELVETAKKEAEEVTARASRDYIKELITMLIYPLLARCTEVKARLDANYFAQDYRTGWPQRYGLAPELEEDEAEVLSIGTFEGQRVFSFPEPMFALLPQGVIYVGNAYSVSFYTHWPTLEGEYRDIASQMEQFDSKLSKLYEPLRSLAKEVKKLVAPYINKSME